MKKLTGLVMTILMISVMILSAAVIHLYQQNEKDNPIAAENSISPSQEESNSSVELESIAEEETLPSFSQENDGKTSDVTKLCCSIQLGTLDIVTGDAFHVTELNGNDYQAYIEDANYIITGSTTYDNHIVVTVPEDYSFESVTLTAMGGVITATGIHTQELLTSCDKGVINYSGTIDKNGNVEQLHGKTVLNLEQKQSDFDYEIHYTSGHVNISEEVYAGINGTQTIDNNAEKTLLVHSTMGSVSVLFENDLFGGASQ